MMIIIMYARDERVKLFTMSRLQTMEQFNDDAADLFVIRSYVHWVHMYEHTYIYVSRIRRTK